MKEWLKVYQLPLPTTKGKGEETSRTAAWPIPRVQGVIIKKIMSLGSILKVTMRDGIWKIKPQLHC